MSDTKVFPVLLSGGSGSRLWPLSREDAPKQLLRLIGDQTQLQQTAMRALDAELFEPLTVIGRNEDRFAIAEQLGEITSNMTIILEPAPRNTAAAAAIAALQVQRSRADGLVLLMPADHVIDDVDAFHAAVRSAIAAARQGNLALFGIQPDSPATGYGYIRMGERLGEGPARHVAAFVEKPDLANAEAYLASGEYLWNSGIFLLPVQELLAEFAAFEPDLLAAAGKALERAEKDTDFLRLEQSSFEQCRSVSVDHAIMERTSRAAVIPVGFSWADLGSWSALWSLAERDETETAAIGNVLTRSTRESYVRSEGPLVVTVGVDDLIVVATDEAVLVARKDHDQDVRSIVEKLRSTGPAGSDKPG